MHRKFIALICSTALAITVAAAPARANNNNDEVAKVLAGLAALAIVGVAIKKHDDRKDRRREEEARRKNPPKQHIKPRPLPPEVARYTLPRQCLRDVDTGWDTTRIMGRGCLKKNYRHVQSLPETCRVRLTDSHKVRNGYRPKCLRKHGYRLSEW